MRFLNPILPACSVPPNPHAIAPVDLFRAEPGRKKEFNFYTAAFFRPLFFSGKLLVVFYSAVPRPFFRLTFSYLELIVNLSNLRREVFFSPVAIQAATATAPNEEKG